MIGVVAPLRSARQERACLVVFLFFQHMFCSAFVCISVLVSVVSYVSVCFFLIFFFLWFLFNYVFSLLLASFLFFRFQFFFWFLFFCFSLRCFLCFPWFLRGFCSLGCSLLRRRTATATSCRPSAESDSVGDRSGPEISKEVVFLWSFGSKKYGKASGNKKNFRCCFFS